VTNHEPQAHGGPVPERELRTFQVPAPAAQGESMGRSSKPFMVAAIMFMLISLGIMFVAVNFANQSGGSSLHKLELKVGGDIRQYLLDANKDGKFRQWARRNPSLRGEQFWAGVLRDRIIDESAPRKLCALTGNDEPLVSVDLLSTHPGPTSWCSFTAPAATDLDALLAPSTGRSVLACFNSRNWNNRPELGVLVIWNDSELSEWLTFEQASADWGITEQEWADPAGKLFGKKAPFQHTYE